MSARALAAGGLALAALVLVLAQRGPLGPARARPAQGAAAHARAAGALDSPRPVADDEQASLAPPAAAAGLAEPAAEATRALRAPAQVYVLHGTLRSRSGQKLSSAYVSATDSVGERRNASSASDDHYAIAGLAPGSWTLSAGAEGHRVVRESLELAPDAPIVRRDFELEPSVVLPVRVLTTDGRQLSQALSERGKAGSRDAVRPLPVATREPPGPTIEDAVDAGNNRVGEGRFWDYGMLVEGLGPGYSGVLEIEGDLPVSVSLVVGARVVATQRVEPGATEVGFTVDVDELLAQQAVVRARFVDQVSGDALEGRLDIQPVDSAVDYVRNGDWSHTLPPGKYTLRFDAVDHARIPIPIELAAGQELDLGEVRVPLGLTIEGRLLDAEGQPVLSDLELGQRDDAGKLRFDPTRGYRSDANGGFAIHGLVAGRFLLRTEFDDDIVIPGNGDPPTIWVSGNVPVSTLGGSVTGLDLHLVRAGILVLKGAATQPEGTRLKILDEHGDLLRWSGLYPGFVPRFALPPGPCTLVVCDEEWTERSRFPLVIGAGVNELELAR